jgi:hypothetical protein
LVALIAAGTAQWRLHLQLDHERQRLKEQLDHDRAMKDLDEVRMLLDRAAEHSEQASDALIEMRHKVEGLADETNVGEMLDRFDVANNALIADALRLRTRGLVDASDAVLAVLEAFNVGLLVEAGQRRRRGDDASEQLAQADQGKDRVTEARRTFYDAARRLAASKVPSS